jgi:hypothetical protein
VTLPGRRWSARWASWALTVPDDGGGLELAVSEGDLDGADVGVGFEQVRGEAVGKGHGVMASDPGFDVSTRAGEGA